MGLTIYMSYVRIFAGLALLIFALSFANGFHPLLDSLSIGRPLVAMTALILAVSFRRPYREIVIVGLLVWLSFFAKTFLPTVSPKDLNFRLYQHNLLFTNTAPDLSLVANQRFPDVMTLQEVRDSESSIRALTNYPYRVICAFEAIGQTAVVSKYPIVKQGCGEGDFRGFAWAQIEIQGKNVTVVSLHLHWPFPHKQSDQIKEILPQLAALPRPIILGGDFNQTRWSHSVKQISEAIGGNVPSQTLFTLNRAPLFLPIDHIISPFEMSVSKLNRYGSDHNGLFAEIALD